MAASSYSSAAMRDDRRSSKRKRATSAGAVRYATASVLKGKSSGYLDLASATYAFDTTGTVTLLNAVPQGTSESQRVGKKVRLTSLQCRGKASNSTTAYGNDCALVIIYDRRPRGSLPTMTDFFTVSSSRGMNNDDNSGRFQILKRMDFTLVGNSTTPTSVSERSIDFFKEINLPCVYMSAGTGLIDDIEQGALYLVTIGSIAAGTAAATSSLAFRLRYLDVNG